MKLRNAILVCLLSGTIGASIALTGCGNNEAEIFSSGYQQTAMDGTAINNHSSQKIKLDNAELDEEHGLIVLQKDGHWMGVEMFNSTPAEKFVSAVNSLRENVSSDVKIWLMPCPLSSEYYTPEKYKAYCDSQEQFFTDVSEKLSDGINFINIAPELKNHAAEYIYFRTDGHWTALGAYYAAEEFAGEAGVPFGTLESDFEKKTTEDFVGSLYAKSNDSRLNYDADIFTYYVPKAQTQTVFYNQSFENPQEGAVVCRYVEDNDLNSNEYSRFIGGDNYAVRVQTGVDNNRKLLVIKDSFGNAEVPFLVNSFSDIYVVDLRYFECNAVDFINDFGITDVLITCSSSTMTGEDAEGLSKLVSTNTKQANPNLNQSVQDNPYVESNSIEESSDDYGNSYDDNDVYENEDDEITDEDTDIDYSWSENHD